MPRLSWHIQKKQRDFNANTLLASRAPDFMDWQVITLFYSAMHHVDAVISALRSRGIAIPEPHSHKERRRIVFRFLKPILDDYKMLDKISQWARYSEVGITPTILSTATSSHSSIVSYLSTIVP